MVSDYVMTTEQLEEQVRTLRKVFDVVRFLDANNLRLVSGNGHEVMCECFKFWQKDHRCDNCISRKVAESKQERTKLEYVDFQLYQVISRYIEVDGSGYVMELVKKLDDDSLIDNEGSRKLMDSLTGLKHKLYEDVLTGAYNRRYFEEEVKNIGTTVGVAIIDLDDFKIYNDTYGHGVGDTVLSTTASVIRQCIRKSDILIRYGGDEFLLVLPEVKEDILNDKLQQIQRKIHATEIPGYPNVRLSVSIGGIVCEDGSIEEAVAKADRLMYRAKNKKNMVVTEQNIDDDINTLSGENGYSSDKQNILVIDDNRTNRELLKTMFNHEYNVIEASGGPEGLEILKAEEYDFAVVLLDIIMSGMDGFSVMTSMRADNRMRDIPVIMISTEDRNSTITKAYDLGIADYISMPFDSRIVYRRVSNVIKLYAKQRRLMNLVTESIQDKENNNQMMIGILSHIVEFRNGESGQHVLHINQITQMFLETLTKKTGRYNLTWHDRFIIATASALHDIGKIGIPEEIINKPARLTTEEFEIMKKHTVIGEDILKKLDTYQDEKLVQVAMQICRSHHERYDGKGYPDGLKGEDIPICAQVVSVADVYDALTSNRVYKKAYSHEKAMQMILNGECGTFNPLLLDCLIEIQDRL